MRAAQYMLDSTVCLVGQYPEMLPSDVAKLGSTYLGFVGNKDLFEEGIQKDWLTIQQQIP